jgi:hypothetical protein
MHFNEQEMSEEMKEEAEKAWAEKNESRKKITWEKVLKHHLV